MGVRIGCQTPHRARKMLELLMGTREFRLSFCERRKGPSAPGRNMVTCFYFLFFFIFCLKTRYQNAGGGKKGLGPLRVVPCLRFRKGGEYSLRCRIRARQDPCNLSILIGVRRRWREYSFPCWPCEGMCTCGNNKKNGGGRRCKRFPHAMLLFSTRRHFGCHCHAYFVHRAILIFFAVLSGEEGERNDFIFLFEKLEM
jgi:hypothetical protein